MKNLLSATFALAVSMTAAGADEAERAKAGCCHSPDPSKLVLPADEFFGKAAVSYEAAKEIPNVLCKLFCYCGCDVVEKHTSLLECFVSDHGADCIICQDEAVEASSLKKQGKTIAEIQQTIDKHYEKMRNAAFTKPSPALLEYRAKRLYKPKKNVEKVGDKT